MIVLVNFRPSDITTVKSNEFPAPVNGNAVPSAKSIFQSVSTGVVIMSVIDWWPDNAGS